MLKKRDSKKEKKIIEELISEDDILRKQHELFEAEMAFKQEIIDARKAESLTQKDISNMTGLSQQAVSRLETSASGTIETIIRYLNSIGYSLTIRKKV
jgi:DNA-directed RNA polymerase specialized sigma subunit